MSLVHLNVVAVSISTTILLSVFEKKGEVKLDCIDGYGKGSELSPVIE